ncbi:MAG TPA: hypothetical protein VG457_03580 [Planctomycetota bacterium]|jgi:hypothetical protein|nr:hypothetical protein [Planctomycetota bacterium]
MRAFADRRSRRSLLAGLLALVLCSSPADALRMMATGRFAAVAARPGACVGARLGLQRRTPPQAIESPGSLVIRKAVVARSPAALAVEAREWGTAGLERAGFAALRRDAPLKMPAYLRGFLSSSPQRPLYPPAEPVLLAS